MKTLKEKLGSIEILMVEDNMGDYLLISKFLNTSFFKSNVNVVRNGEDAMDYLRQKGPYQAASRPDLVLLDWNIPLKTGYEVLKEIKGDGELAAITVIIFTDSVSHNDSVAAYQARADFYMIKPRNLDQFATSVHYLEKIWLEKLAGL